jgi:hypothetical protein
MTDIVAATTAYETWLGTAIPLVAADIKTKHEVLANDELKFLRGTYYYWVRSMQTLLPELVQTPTVALVGDLHVENFGTWRDASGVHRWGINDYDELGHGPYAIDLVRLATSGLLVPGLQLGRVDLCRLLVDTWSSAVPSAAVDLDEGNTHHLKHLLPPAKPDSFFDDLETGIAVPHDAIPIEIEAAVLGNVEGWTPQWHAREAGTGSLGHPRYVAVGKDIHGKPKAREAKLLGPLSAIWAGLAEFRADDGLYQRVLDAVHGPSPAFRIDDWQVRRLAPDVLRIDIAGLGAHDEERVVQSMAHALVNVHGIDPSALADARADAAQRGKHWLADSVEVMLTDTHAAWNDWRHR